MTRILEPTSVYCLDWEGDSGAESRRAPGLVRHLSMSAADPNVMDQVVWKTHCKRIETKGITTNVLDTMNCINFVINSRIGQSKTKVCRLSCRLMKVVWSIKWMEIFVKLNVGTGN